MIELLGSISYNTLDRKLGQVLCHAVLPATEKSSAMNESSPPLAAGYRRKHHDVEHAHLTSTTVAFNAKGSAAHIALVRSTSSASLPLNTAGPDLSSTMMLAYVLACCAGASEAVLDYGKE